MFVARSTISGTRHSCYDRAPCLRSGSTRTASARGITGGRTGTVTVMQRAGGGLNVNPHFHTLVLDGVFRQAAGRLELHSTPGPSEAEVAEILTLIHDRIQRLLQRRGLAPEDDATGPVDRLGEESPLLAGLVSASARGEAGRTGHDVAGAAAGAPGGVRSARKRVGV